MAAIHLETASGLALLVRYQTWGTVLALLVLLMPTTLVFHAVPRLACPPRPQQMDHLRKHLASEGGRLQLMANAASAFALDRVGVPTATAYTVVRKERLAWSLARR